MTRFAMTLEYDGRPFMGLQRQKHGPSVQQAVEEAVEATIGLPVTLYAAGRTDAGVHAEAMRVHVDVERDFDAFRLMEAVNAHLRPAPIAVSQCNAVDEEWHARFSCIGRRYRYDIINRRAPLTWQKGLAWRVAVELDAEAMHEAAEYLVGQHDFTTFRSAHCQAQSPVKTLDRIDVVRQSERISVHVAARSFLHHQVRSMVGCLSLVGRGQWSADDLQAALEAKDRQALGLNAPPDGLYFVEAVYP
ncbi:tRNA pseudouridine(38-40) synthase TruA [Alterisphingorhabdus coralli]|uniref:tRNA pseudouridine synthase A n=1 Tax=Alterisphingorhabdus coralli TaxID=3071408 RepID=A0AA97HZF1_9SPHN|nr:tRNA pseudouridine(38-40) synthase TruA [Parasphingorhabdus sp. SCSIO 66989]WOE73787.1 tRNA pseudouridine(38-40) synthase TruA [Parasphingorhabdus sp. SCSIO 66989]